ncbi:excisionase [Streptococcus equi subsp. equi]|uniref:excisionase n=1 Tax=Streptococcus equi TaxID=1336 RepID=UPI001BDE12B5|nr:excisionase [Streptococcus equi subsp. equi]
MGGKKCQKAELVYRPAKQSEKAEAGDYEHLCQIWEGLTVGTAKVWAAEMRDHPDFKQFINNPTHRIVFIDYEGFRFIVKWKSRNRYKPKKETLAEMLENIKFEKRVGA